MLFGRLGGDGTLWGDIQSRVIKRKLQKEKGKIFVDRIKIKAISTEKCVTLHEKGINAVSRK